jgi:hypothetical protein
MSYRIDPLAPPPRTRISTLHEAAKLQQLPQSMHSLHEKFQQSCEQHNNPLVNECSQGEVSPRDKYLRPKHARQHLNNIHVYKQTYY